MDISQKVHKSISQKVHVRSKEELRQDMEMMMSVMDGSGRRAPLWCELSNCLLGRCSIKK